MNLTFEQEKALQGFLSSITYYTLGDLGPRLTCEEAEAWVDFLHAFKDPGAEVLLQAHAEGDDEETDTHHGWGPEEIEDYFTEDAAVLTGLQTIEKETR